MKLARRRSPVPVLASSAWSAAGLSLAALASLAACGEPAAPPPVMPPPQPTVTASAPPPPPPAPPPPTTGVPRKDWNRLAVELNLPLYWSLDANNDGALDPSELAVLWNAPKGTSLATYVDARGAFTPALHEAHAKVLARHGGDLGKAPATPAEVARRAAVVKELAQGRPTLVLTDFTGASAGEAAFLGHLLTAVEVIERLYQTQMGTYGLRAQVPEGDTASQALFFRNQGPRCEAPATQHDPACSALPGVATAKTSGLYPASELAKPKFCDALAKADKALVDPFTVVVAGDGGALKAVPYHQHFASDFKTISSELRAASAALGGEEASLRAYLEAQAKAFEDGSWFAADEAWAKMGVKNSRYYLRIAPDEVYAEPCSTKALFHVSFGLINKKSIAWQDKLDPLKTEMENALAALAGGPYKARAVSFKLPDFVDIALNAGDSRNPFGATIGQSLPNFGPVANEGRGRTVAMTNFYTDPDSLTAQRSVAESLFCKSVMPSYTTDPEPQLMSTVLHEAAHNLGPAHQYKVKGKIDRDQFGGPLASTLEELKAQSAALYFTDWLVTKGKITRAEADLAHVRDIAWAFGHISRGMYTDDGHPKNYSQLAAIQLGVLMSKKAVTWNPAEPAANGKDTGCFSIDLKKFPDAALGLMREVAGVKARGDKAAGERLVRQHAGPFRGPAIPLHAIIAERALREPKPSFVYSLKR
ncbi:MAG TPA: hypothetical protein PLR99_00730 [Polyangiaceae bacterium]|nr:hypothetical protein [Polyangiaceae bacterium]